MKGEVKKHWTFMSVPIAGTLESEKAYRLDIDMPDNSIKVVWIPKSQIQEWHNKGDEISFWAATWLVAEKELEDFVDSSYEPTLF